MEDQKGYNANFGDNDVSVSQEEYMNNTDNDMDFPEDTTEDFNEDTTVDDVEELAYEEDLSEEYDDDECGEEVEEIDEHYMKAQYYKHAYEETNEKYVDALETIKELSKKLLEFL